MSRPIIIFLSLTTILISVNGCKRRATAPQEPAVAATSPAQQQQYHHPEGGTTPAGETRHFMGSIGSTGGLQMKLTREGESLTGNYFYQKIGTKIDLKGTIDKDGNVSLEEFDSSGKQTGIFKGMWRPDEDGLINIVGNWMKPGSDKKTAFSLHEEPIELSAGAGIL